MTGMWIAGAIGLGVGALVFWLGGRWGQAHRAFRANAVRATGTIVALDGEDQDMPTVEFTDAAGRTRRVEGRSNVGRNWSVGSPVVVFYDPADPSDAHLEHDMVASPFVAMLVGVIFVFFGVVALVFAAMT